MEEKNDNDSQFGAWLSRFPKSRPILQPEYQRIYEREYLINRDGLSLVTKLSSRLESWMHKRVGMRSGGSVLELGGGTLNHLQFEKTVGVYDIVEPFKVLYKDSPNLPKIRAFYDDIADIPKDMRYSRVISIAVLEHLVDLPKVLAHSAFLMDKEGVFQAGIPSEGGALWKFAWRATTGIGFWFRNRLDYKVLMEYEHVNTAPEIEQIVKYFFHKVKVCRFPLPFLAGSFYSYIEAREPHMDRVTELLQRLNDAGR